MSFAGCFIVGMTVNAFTTYKDLRITPSSRKQTIPDWGYEEQDKAVKFLAKGPIVFHPEVYKSLQHEGLGVDHEEWLKNKANRK